jgi:hypothetical protein
MGHNKIICVYCKRNAKLIKSDNTTTVVCSHCGIATGLETYKELFDKWVFEMTNDFDE